MSKSAKEIYEGLNDSEKFGVKFGLFPARVGMLDHETVVELMKLAGEVA